LHGGAQPAWDPAEQRCAGTYCHGPLSPSWVDPTPIGCDTCHDAPPKDHARWSRVAIDASSCTTCHPSATEATHVDGHVDVTVSSCTTCHGSDGHASPPAALDGTTDPTSRGVGAHERHLNAALSDRISEPVLCETCHVVPSDVLSPGHIDQPTTQVRFPFGGTYDAANAACTVWCHFDRSPGPTWTDASGAARRCDACHDFPPKITRKGTPHPSVAGDLTVCTTCHLFDRTTHVNGVVDFVGQP
jgi:predicted CxxxxCH...CXXCH cytochrome family protein